MKHYFSLFSLITIFSIGCSQQTDNTKSEIKYNKTAIALNNQATSFVLTNPDSALILLDSAIKIDPSYYLAYNNKAGIYTSQKRLKKALKELEMVIKVKPDLAEAYGAVGSLTHILGDSIKAREYYIKGLEIFNERIDSQTKPEFINANRSNRAFLLLALGKEQEGKNELKDLAKIDSNLTMIIGNIDEFDYNEFMKKVYLQDGN